MLVFAAASTGLLRPFSPRARGVFMEAAMMEPTTAEPTSFSQILVGDLIPATVEVETTGGEWKEVGDMLGSGVSVLLGMPGAFTPTCSDKHLPGYLSAVSKFSELNVESISVVTMNDQWVASRWAEVMGSACAVDPPSSDAANTDAPTLTVQLLSDPRGDLCEALGLIGYLGRDLGIRSKRFALVVVGGVVAHVAVDEGADVLDATSAERLLDVVSDIEAKRQARLQAERSVAAELSIRSAPDARAFLTASDVQETLLNAGTSQSELDAAVAVIDAELSRRRAVANAAELALAAEIYKLSAAEALACLSDPSTERALQAAYVGDDVLEACITVLNAALATGARDSPRAPSQGTGSGVSPAMGAGVVVLGAALAALAALGLQHEGGVDLGTLDTVRAVVDSAAKEGGNLGAGGM